MSSRTVLIAVDAGRRASRVSFVPTVLASPRALWVNLLVPTRATTFSPTDCIVVDAEKHASPVKFVPMGLVACLVLRVKPNAVACVWF